MIIKVREWLTIGMKVLVDRPVESVNQENIIRKIYIQYSFTEQKIINIFSIMGRGQIYENWLVDFRDYRIVVYDLNCAGKKEFDLTFEQKVRKVFASKEDIYIGFGKGIVHSLKALRMRQIFEKSLDPMLAVDPLTE